MVLIKVLIKPFPFSCISMSKISYRAGRSGCPMLHICTISTILYNVWNSNIRQKFIIFLPDEVQLKKRHICVFHGTSSSATSHGRHFKISQEILHFSLSYRILPAPMKFTVCLQPLADSLFQLNNLNCRGLLTLNRLYQTDVMILYISNAEWCIMVSRVRLPLRWIFVNNLHRDVEYLSFHSGKRSQKQICWFKSRRRQGWCEKITFLNTLLTYFTHIYDCEV